MKSVLVSEVEVGLPDGENGKRLPLRMITTAGTGVG
jgi:hypothetical protein